MASWGYHSNNMAFIPEVNLKLGSDGSIYVLLRQMYHPRGYKKKAYRWVIAGVFDDMKEVFKMPKIKTFYCRFCIMRFKVEVEPDYTTEELKREYKKALEWLNELKTCPVCENELEKEK